jgi:segregation and condensation protein B
MDEISRELPPDTTTSNEPRERQKGPEELVAFERGQVAENLVVRGRFTMPVEAMSAPETNAPGDADGPGQPVDPAMASDPVPAGEAAASVPAEPVAQTQSEPLGFPEANAELAAPAVETPEVATPAVETPAAETPAAETPAAETPAAETPAAEKLTSEIAADDAAAAVAAEAEVAAIEEEIEHVDEEGLPPAPELTDAAEVAKVVYVLMLTSREGLSMLRLAQACNTTQKLVAEALELLQQQMRSLGLPVELARSGDTVKWMSGASAFVYLQRLRGVKKLEKLSPAALETLAVIAYRQPVMRSEIEAIRGVKAGPMLRTLLQHKLVRCTGRAEVPGRPLQYGTTQQFLDRFGLGSLQELPSVKEWKNLG